MSNRYEDGNELLQASKEGGYSKVVELLGMQVDPNYMDVLSGMTPLQLAASCGHIKIVELLLRKGAQINKISGDIQRTALECAAITGRTDVVKLLLQNGALVQDGSEGDRFIDEVVRTGDHAIAVMLRNARDRSKHASE